MWKNGKYISTTPTRVAIAAMHGSRVGLLPITKAIVVAGDLKLFNAYRDSVGRDPMGVPRTAKLIYAMEPGDLKGLDPDRTILLLIAGAEDTELYKKHKRLLRKFRQPFSGREI